MAQPLVIAYYLIWTAYGWWLPNDPRSNGSQTVRCDVHSELNQLHFGRKRIRPSARQVREFYEQAADLLKHPLLTFDESCVTLIAESFGRMFEREHYTCYACAIMPDHLHLVLRKHKHQAEEMVENLMAGSRALLIENGQRSATHPTWTAGLGWKVFLEHPDEVRRTNRYVEQNPIKDGLPAQSWPFVTDYNDWPLHPGHSPNSPYAKRLRAAGRYP